MGYEQMNVLAWWCAVCAVCTVVRAAGPLRTRSTFDLQSTVLLNELTGKDRDVGYRLRGALHLEPRAADPDAQSLLLEFRLEGVELQLRGAARGAEWARRPSLWDAAPSAPFYALRTRTALRAWLPRADPPDVRNYKRALLSLFQFQLEDGEYAETDVSGECDVLYETVSSTVFRKTKRRCAFEASGARARRVSRYTLSASRRALLALHAEELVWLSPEEEGEGEGALGVKARSWHELRRRSEGEEESALPEGVAPLADALAALPADLLETPLPLTREDDEDDDDVEERQTLAAALATGAAALEGSGAGAGGTHAQTVALRPVLRALQAASAPQLRDALHREDMQDRLAGLCRALGLAGTPAAWSAARDFLAPGAPDALAPLALHYLAGAALAPAIHPDVLEALLALGEEARREPVREAALLAAAAAAARSAPEPAQRRARDRLARQLARCAGEACRASRLRALGNLRRADAADALLAAAERGARAEAEAALGALRALPERALGSEALERALRLAGNASRPLGARALALELAVERLTARAGLPLGLVRLARALGSQRGAGAQELRRALWQRLEARGGREGARALLTALPRDLRTWDARAAGGTSHVLRRALGWEGGGWRAELHSAQLASRGLLRRGEVALRALHDSGAELDLLAVEVWTQGLEAIAGGGEAGEGQGQGEGEGEGEGEALAAGLQLSVLGAALPPVELFAGQAELLAHVWAGTGSAPTPVLRALLPLRTLRMRAPLQAGAVVSGGAHASAALALDAHGSVSLWHRTARARLALRVAAHAHAHAALRTAWSVLRAQVQRGGEARVRVAPDLDFYDAVALCVRVDVSPHESERTVTLSSEGAVRVRRTRTARVTRAGRTLALGRDNDAACRVLRAVDSEDDA